MSSSLTLPLTFVIFNVHRSLCFQEQRDELSIPYEGGMVQSREPARDNIHIITCSGSTFSSASCADPDKRSLEVYLLPLSLFYDFLDPPSPIPIEFVWVMDDRVDHC